MCSLLWQYVSIKADSEESLHGGLLSPPPHAWLTPYLIQHSQPSHDRLWRTQKTKEEASRRTGTPERVKRQKQRELTRACCYNKDDTISIIGATQWPWSTRTDKNKVWLNQPLQLEGLNIVMLVRDWPEQKHSQKHLTWAKEKNNWTVAQWSKILFSDESKFCISFGNQGPRVWRKSGEAQNPCCLKSSVKFPQSVMILAAMSSAGLVHCVFWSPQSTQTSTRNF